ncbi:MAG: chromate transporter [Candidatus Cloacimonetes bacterium]|nr:chromate transporter [Candidatus Cloacimonadota bacterium]
MLWQLLITFFKIGLFSVGGGYPMLSMIHQEVVVKHGWMTSQQVTDMVAISQMTPGPIAINVATFIGYKQAGFLGAVFTTLGVVLPSLILMFLITFFYLKLRGKGWFDAVLKGLRPLIVGLIVSAAWLTAKSAFVDWFGIAVFAICFFLSLKYKVNPVILMLGAGIAGVLIG